MDQQNLSLVKLLLKKGADPNLLTSGGHTPYHLTYGRDNDDIRKELHSLTKPDLRELPDSESDDSEGEEDEESDEEVFASRASTSELARGWWLTSGLSRVHRWATMTFSGMDISRRAAAERGSYRGCRVTVGHVT